MKVINYTKLRLNLRKELDEVVSTNTPTCVTSTGDKQVVIVSKEQYDELIKESR